MAGGVGNASLEIFMIHLFPLMLFPECMHDTSNMIKALICAVACISGIVIHKIVEAVRVRI